MDSGDEYTTYESGKRRRALVETEAGFERSKKTQRSPAKHLKNKRIS